MVASLTVLLAGLAGCGREDPGPVRTRIPAGLQSRFYPPASWTWGRLSIAGAPPLRYGVAAPPKAARAQVVILPDAGEPAEVWFETAQALVERNYVVWVLDLAGQGGSGRWLATSGRAYTPSMDLDLTALRVLVGRLVRPGAAPVVLLGDDLGGQLALRALSQGLAGVDGAVVGDPLLETLAVGLPGEQNGAVAADWLARAGLGRAPAPGSRPWREADSAGRGREAVAQQWMRGNPDLRLGGFSLGWAAAYNRSAAAARSPAALRRISTPVLIFARPGLGPEAKAACAAIPACRFAPLAGDGPVPHLAADAVRGPWLAQTIAFIEARGEGFSVAAAPARK